MSLATQDHEYMARAIALAKKGRYTTSPNPNVGCVIVKNGEIVGEGWHEYAGGPHAEVMALRAAGDNAAGATCYVTLEPCSHYGRTPPCADTLIAAKVGRVVAAMVDPNPKVSGRGLARIEAAGIATESGLLSEQAFALNSGFVKRMRGEGPYIKVKLAATLDGKTALANGKSQWITSPHARKDVQEYRAQSCAIISGADTVLADNASLNVRFDELTMAQNIIKAEQVRQPIRVIIDSQCRLTPDLKLFSIESPIILVRASDKGSQKSNQQWPDFVEQVSVDTNANGKVNLQAVVELLTERNCNNLWVEAGATLAGAFVNQGFVDELIVYQAPKLIGSAGRSMVHLDEYDDMGQLKSLQILDITRVGPDIRITAKCE